MLDGEVTPQKGKVMDKNVKKVLEIVHAQYKSGEKTIDDGYISDHIREAVDTEIVDDLTYKPDLTDECVKLVWRFACSAEFYADPEDDLDNWEDGHGPEDVMATDEIVIDLLERVLQDV